MLQQMFLIWDIKVLRSLCVFIISYWFHQCGSLQYLFNCTTGLREWTSSSLSKMTWFTLWKAWSH